MDGRIGITAVDATTCLLSFAADYVPPLGRLGERLDQYAMSRVAEATARVIADRLARTLSRPEA